MDTIKHIKSLETSLKHVRDGMDYHTDELAHLCNSKDALMREIDRLYDKLPSPVLTELRKSQKS